MLLLIVAQCDRDDVTALSKLQHSHDVVDVVLYAHMYIAM